MFRIDGMSRTPVYEQLIDQVERLVGGGILSPGDQLPSVRSLSIELSINPNTIQKAYSELDSRGIVRSVPGKGCFVSEDAGESLKKAGMEKLYELTDKVCELSAAGVTRDEIMEAVQKGLKNNERNKL